MKHSGPLMVFLSTIGAFRVLRLYIANFHCRDHSFCCNSYSDGKYIYQKILFWFIVKIIIQQQGWLKKMSSYKKNRKKNNY